MRDNDPLTRADSLVCGVLWVIRILPMSMAKVWKTAVNNKSLERKLLLPRLLWATIATKNHKDVWRKLNLGHLDSGNGTPEVQECVPHIPHRASASMLLAREPFGGSKWRLVLSSSPPRPPGSSKI